MRGMERLAFPVSIVEFQRRFADDGACLDYLAASRWPQGFACPACGGRRAWVLARRHLWECAACGRQTSVTAGTVLDHTHTPADVVVLGGLPGGHAHPGDLRGATAAPAGHPPL